MITIDKIAPHAKLPTMGQDRSFRLFALDRVRIAPKRTGIVMTGLCANIGVRQKMFICDKPNMLACTGVSLAHELVTLDPGESAEISLPFYNPSGDYRIISRGEWIAVAYLEEAPY